ncbi:type II toxin-antitoxin system VapC family toxin [Mesorhizobium xinjiangense]|uniref:type II toxin-antitoxin system VapC family toxin n=1 Tax=Mesorhizobium xinjiangense TaxID=2678685 RepID=UPI0012EE9B3B|nr:type II toxin-antitoxin system VapC family toxin [Mesorhizobium xinjiangense]
MSLVLDASLTVAWFFDDERTTATEDLLERVAEQGAVVPAIWKLEIANGLQTAVRRDRIDRALRDRALERLDALPIAIDPETLRHAWSATLGLADRYGLTPYDASYLELAERRRLPLATLDRALRNAAVSAGIAALGLDGPAGPRQ